MAKVEPKVDPNGVKEKRRKVQVWIVWERQNLAGDSEVQVLLLRTIAARGSFDQPVTGSVEMGESFEAAALREAQEETGLDFVAAVRPYRFEFEFKGRWGPAVERGFSLHIQAGPSEQTPPKVKIDAREHVAYAWVSPDEALTRVKYESNRELLKMVLGLSSGAL